MNSVNFKPTRQSSIGTSLCGYVKTSYSKLVELFGEPNSDGDGYKVSTEWVLKCHKGIVTIYDYKSTALYDDETLSVEAFRELPEYNWHIGGNSQELANELRLFIESR